MADIVSWNHLEPRSQLVSDFFDHMNRQAFAWVVMNNYEDLPRDIPSDIDFSIPPELFRRLDSFVLDFAATVGAQVIQKLWHGNMKCAYILATKSNGTREFVQLDFFTNFSTKGCPALISHDTLIAGRCAMRNFYVPRPEIELIFTAMRRLFKDDWSERHCTRLAELHGRITDINWLSARYGWLQSTLHAAIRGQVETVSNRRALDWKHLRATASRNLSLADKVANAALQTRRTAIRLRDETGQLVVLTAPRESIGTKALETLEMVFHRRIFLDRGSSLTNAAKLALLKRRKGLIFIMAENNNLKGQKLAHGLCRMGLVDQVLHQVGSVNTHMLNFGVSETTFSSDAEAIEIIVSVQAAKAAQAIARGGTQTSDPTA